MTTEITETFKGITHLLNSNDEVTVSITFEFQYQYGYGYGAGEHGSYFDVFGITGDLFGYGVGDFETTYHNSYGFGYGYESSGTTVIQGYDLFGYEGYKNLSFNREFMYANIKIEPTNVGVTPDDEYKVILNVTQPGHIVYGYDIVGHAFSEDDSSKSQLVPCNIFYTDNSGEIQVKINSPYEFVTNFGYGYVNPFINRYFKLLIKVDNHYISHDTQKITGKIKSNLTKGTYNAHVQGYLSF